MKNDITSKGILIFVVCILALIAGILLFMPDNNKSVSNANISEVQNVIVTKQKVTLTIGRKYTITAIVSPSTAPDKSLTYESSNPSIASVDSSGNVKANNVGTTTITVTSNNGKETKCIITVVEKNVPVVSIKLDKNDVTLGIGESITLKLTVTPSNTTDHNYKWTSSDASVASVDSKGKVTAKKAGSTLITVITENKKIAICDITVKAKTNNTIKATGIKLNIASKKITKNDTFKLMATITPSNTTNKKITWKSSNTKVASVDSTGKVTGIGAGTANITATIDGKTATCKVETKLASRIALPASPYIKYESKTLKYYVINKGTHYLTYIWMEDPYAQIKKIDAVTATYGKIITDAKIEAGTYKKQRRTVQQMLTSYINLGMISKNKGLVAFNGSGFSVSGTWEPPSPYYDIRTKAFVVINEGVVTRKRIVEDNPKGEEIIIGIASNGNLKVYGKGPGKDSTVRQQIYDKLMKDKVRNTWSFRPQLVGPGITLEATAANKKNAKRNIICQVDANNYIMYSSKASETNHLETSKYMKSLGCKIAFNLDGGGSTSISYKKSNDKSPRQLLCSDGTDHKTCRSIIEGIYFVEK